MPVLGKKVPEMVAGHLLGVLNKICGITSTSVRFLQNAFNLTLSAVQWSTIQDDMGRLKDHILLFFRNKLGLPPATVMTDGWFGSFLRE